jgi:protein SCO1/2
MPTPIPSRALLTFARTLHHPIPQLQPWSTQCQRLANTSPVQSRLTVRTTSRAFSASSREAYKTVQEQRSRYRSGVCHSFFSHSPSPPLLFLILANKTKPFSWRAGLLFLTSGAGLIFYFRYEKARMERKRIADAAKGVGKPKVGGPFELVDQRGKLFTEGDMRGRYSLVGLFVSTWENETLMIQQVYFGFSHCPDICPEELDKMATIIDLVSTTTPPSRPKLLPLFITCDPARDTPAVLSTYLSEFHPAIIGLTGTWEQVKAVCKAYRVYFSTPEGVKPGQDYLVDHSIYFYLMDPEGDFVEAIGRQHSPEQAAEIIRAHVGDWKGT